MIDYSSLLHLLHLTRRVGKTTSAIDLAKKTNSILVCSTHNDANKIAKGFKVQTVSIHSIDKLRGFGRINIILDQDVITDILERLENPHKSQEDLFKGIDDLIKASPTIALTSSSTEIRERAESILSDNT